MDIDTLKVRGHWDTMEELLQVLTCHLSRYENPVKMCKSSSDRVKLSKVNICQEICIDVIVYQSERGRS